MNKKFRILNIEDEEIDHLALLRYVREKGLPYDVDRAVSIAEAASLLEKNSYDAVLIDYRLPDGTGLDLLQRLKGMASIFLTGSGDETVAVKAIKGGALDYVVKDQARSYLDILPVVIEKAVEICRLRKEERDMRDREELYHTLFEQSPEGIMIIDPKTQMPVEFNDTACRQLGYSRAEIARLRISDYSAVETQEKIDNRIERILLVGRDDFETRHSTKQGEIRNVLVTMQAIELHGAPYINCIYRDITSIRRAEEKLKNEIETTTHLLMIAEATAHTMDIDRLMEKVAHCSGRILGSDIVVSYLWDKEAKAFAPSKSYGLEQRLVSVFMTEPLSENIELFRKALEKKDVFVPPTSFYSKGWAEESGIDLLHWLFDVRTIAVIPLMGRNAALGLIIILYKAIRSLTERDMKVMKAISNQVSTALEEARLYKDSIDKTVELSQKIETIKVMNEIDRSILSTLEPQDMLEIVSRMISKIIPCDRATIALVDREKGGFTYAAGFGVDFMPKGAFVPFKDTSAAEVIETARPQYAHNLAEIDGLPSLEKALVKKGFLSHIRMPLSIKGEVVGVLNVGAKRPSAFSREDFSTLEKLGYQIGVALANARLVFDLSELFIGTVRSLSSAIDAKSPWTAGHSERVTKYAIAIAKEMRMEEKELKDLELAGLLHDIGKIGTYETILDKPGKLTDDELKLMRQHSVKSAEILQPIKQFKNIIPGIRHHHEFYDGTGYPDGLKEEAIPFLARILAVADTVDAMSADRPYRKERPMDAIIEELKRCAGAQFDPKVVEAFMAVQSSGGGS